MLVGMSWLFSAKRGAVSLFSPPFKGGGGGGGGDERARGFQGTGWR